MGEPLTSQIRYHFHHSSFENSYCKMFSVRKAVLKKSVSPHTSEVPSLVVANVLKNRTSEAGLEVYFSRKL